MFVTLFLAAFVALVLAVTVTGSAYGITSWRFGSLSNALNTALGALREAAKCNNAPRVEDDIGLLVHQADALEEAKVVSRLKRKTAKQKARKEWLGKGCCRLGSAFCWLGNLTKSRLTYLAGVADVVTVEVIRLTPKYMTFVTDQWTAISSWFGA